MGCCASIDIAAESHRQPMPTKKSSLAQKQTNEEKKSPRKEELPEVAEVIESQNSTETRSKVPKLDLTKAVHEQANSVKPIAKTNAVPINNNINEKPAPNLNIQKQPQTVNKANGFVNNTVNVKHNELDNVSVAPDIFVSLKKGHINDYYKIGKTLGEGAYGKVYQVTHRTTGIVRAMKSIKKRSVIKEEAEKLFTEVSILKTLDHPNIVKLYELYQDDNNFYLITEFCTGGELFDRIQQMRSFTEKMAAEYMKQILGAVVYCHSKNIVHRDLKPENLLLDSNKPDANLKVIDFGTSKKFADGKKMTQKFGTAYYIAPEVLNKNYDERCDVWSCGVILYILLCGYPPFGGANDHEILQRVKIGKFKFDEEDWGKISIDAKNLIKKMLTYNPADRISAKEALNDSWIQSNSISNSVSTKALQNLTAFRSKSKLKQAILAFIATQMTTQQEKDELQKTFQGLDRDGNGVLTKEELIEGYKKVLGNREDAEVEVRKILEEVDINKSGQIDFTEFIIAAMNREKLLSKQKLEQAFKIFDIDGDGYITRLELASVMGGIELDDEQWKKLVEEVDTNSDGKISQKEFVQLLGVLG